MRRVKRWLLRAAFPCTVLCGVTYLAVHAYRTRVPTGTDRIVSILVWQSFGGNFFERILSDDAVKECPFRCKFTQDRKQLDRSDVVVLQTFFGPFWRSLPPRRKPGQAWLLYAMEPPYRLPANPSRLDKLGINWTLSYRFDADVVHRHSFRTVRRSTTEQIFSAPDPKPKLAAWIVSNCRSFNHRERYVREMQKFVSVDIFGSCGRHRCHQKHFGCYKEIASNYSFYLAFENSICKDYSTEKLFHPLLNDMVPVVMGGVNYSQVAPPGSYIDFASYRTARDLAAYLLELQRRPDAYRRYFDWKKEYTIERPPFGCSVCQQIHRLLSRATKRQPRRSLYKYLWGDAQCMTWEELLKKKWSPIH